jgi:hypothetical protein
MRECDDLSLRELWLRKVLACVVFLLFARTERIAGKGKKRMDDVP